ncbi:hypothetical protein EC991_008686 [Linnemannia zychae]|nr:hypothetical protein EC991_008686 [Linnemannia zychae]
MKFPSSKKLLLLCVAIALAATPLTNAQKVDPLAPPVDPPAPTGPTTTAGPVNPTTPVKPPTTPPTIPPTSAPPPSTVPPVIPPTSTVPPVVPTAPPPPPPPPPVTTATPTFTPPTTPKSCLSTGDCQQNEYCGYTLQSYQSSPAMGICITMVQGFGLCRASPAQSCAAHSDCRQPAFSFCSSDIKQCVGTGVPGTASECKDGNNGQSGNKTGGDKSSDTLTNTLKYAGIGIGSVAFLGLCFAVVRWRSNKKKRSRKMPDFSDVDYGMSTTAARSKSHRRQQRQSEPRSSLGAAGAGEGQAYPFSNRPAAGAGAGAVAGAGDQDGYYNDQYYDDSYAQHNNKGGYDNYGNQGYDNYGYGQQGQYGYDQQGYDQQGYDQQGYDQQGYYKEENTAYEGYDQHGNYVGTGVAGADQTGFYDQQGYDYSQQQHQDYQYPAASGAPDATAAVATTPGAGAGAAAGAVASGVAYPAATAAVSPRRNGGAEMMSSEQDYGRHY